MMQIGRQSSEQSIQIRIKSLLLSTTGGPALIGLQTPETWALPKVAGRGREPVPSYGGAIAGVPVPAPGLGIRSSRLPAKPVALALVYAKRHLKKSREGSAERVKAVV